MYFVILLNKYYILKRKSLMNHFSENEECVSLSSIETTNLNARAVVYKVF